MMITKQEALTAKEFHYGACKKLVGPRGGVKLRMEVWRRNGATKVWKTRPDQWEIPVKHGLYDYYRITDTESHMWHTAESCPILLEENAGEG